MRTYLTRSIECHCHTSYKAQVSLFLQMLDRTALLSEKNLKTQKFAVFPPFRMFVKALFISEKASVLHIQHDEI